MNAFEWPAKGRKTVPPPPQPEVPWPEAIDGALTAAYVAADQDLFWLAEHGELERAARKLAALRAMVEARTAQ